MYKPTMIFLMWLTLITACSDNSGPSKSYQHATGNVLNATISDHGLYSLVASGNHATGLWDLKQNALLYAWKNTPQNPVGIIATAISEPAAVALTAEKNNLVLWDMKSGKALNFWQVRGQIQAIAIDQAGHYALLGYTDGMAEYIDLHLGQSSRRFHHADQINDVTLSTSGRYALTGSRDKTAILWDIQTGEAIYTWRHNTSINKVIISPLNHYALTAASHDSVKLWDIKTGKLIHEIKQQDRTVTAMKFSPSEKYFVVATSPQTITVWGTQRGDAVKSWQVPKDEPSTPTLTMINAIGFNSRENQIWTEASNGKASMWKFP